MKVRINIAASTTPTRLTQRKRIRKGIVANLTKASVNSVILKCHPSTSNQITLKEQRIIQILYRLLNWMSEQRNANQIPWWSSTICTRTMRALILMCTAYQLAMECIRMLTTVILKLFLSHWGAFKFIPNFRRFFAISSSSAWWNDVPGAVECRQWNFSNLSIL